jgi:hypothetical protein
MPFRSSVFTLAKDAEHPGENQDVCRVDGARGVAVIADGVASGIFSRRWAEILTEAVVADPPDPADRPAFAARLAAWREAWAAGVDVASLAWFQKAKMRQGAFSTLLWVRLDMLEPTDPARPPGFRLRGHAIGDSCLLHVRGQEVLRTFPIQHSAELEADPVVLGSLDLGRDHLLEFRSLETDCRPGDLVVLCTDAVAQWALRGQEQGRPPSWDRYAAMDEAQWREEISDLRERREMRYDDATLAVLRVSDRPVETVHGHCPEFRDVRENGAVPLTGQGPPKQTAAAPGPPSREPGKPVPPLRPAAPVELIPPGEPAPQDWKTKLKSLSEEFADQVGQQLSRGLEQLKKARHSADGAIRKYREKLRSRNKKDQ